VLIEKQREQYTQMLVSTEKRVVQANMSIAQLYSSELKDEDKRKAAEYLAAQVYQLYEERREVTKENDIMK
jgi:hypothetical protein